ncbi:CsbD family protein [Thiothrix nivea]|uniref:CsbD family protein n=1 Tax=Thiothrix nivea (strain ATCC 35100 / DSM 5205 / JP2) TaxID=870187 RepID=A0A656HHN9_THINJ|nr:CsbD family protein [Thiothrix nivea]EIJ36448.1 CsbD family protein [Thiothrix nivea DSM 5205]
MNMDQIAGNWTQLKGKIKEQFGKLTDDDMTEIEGKAEVLVGKLQERYGITREEAQKMADDMNL